MNTILHPDPIGQPTDLPDFGQRPRPEKSRQDGTRRAQPAYWVSRWSRPLPVWLGLACGAKRATTPKPRPYCRRA
jgi:hypothetical protein